MLLGALVCVAFTQNTVASTSDNQDKTCVEWVYDETTLGPKWLKKVADDFKDTLRLPPAEEILAEFPELAETQMPHPSAILAQLKARFERQTEVARNKIVKAYTTASKQKGRTVSLDELALFTQVKREDLAVCFGDSGLFKSLEHLKEICFIKSPNVLTNVMDTQFFNDERIQKMVTAIEKRSRLIVTTVVAGAPVNRGFFAALTNYAKLMDAEILVFPANMITNGLDPLVKETEGVHVITHSVLLSPWLKLNRIKLMAKQINPLMGLDGIGPRGQSQVVGSPQIRLRTVPIMDNAQYPHRLLSTGGLTDPNYNGQLYVSGRTDEIATNNHVLGAVILEKGVARSKLTGFSRAGSFHMRHIEYFPEKEGFTDLGVFYNATEAVKTRPKALVLGDIHVGSTDQKLFESLKKQILKMKPEYVVLHDILDGFSVSPHERDKVMSLAEKARRGQLNLDFELGQVVAFTNALLDIDHNLKIVVVPSNHDFWLTRWLEAGQFMKEPHNQDLGIELVMARKNGKDPLEYALMERSGAAPKIAYPKRFIFLHSGDDFKLGPEHRLVEVGVHGHVGANGGKGSINSLRVAADRIIFGHTHTYQRFNGAVNVGTFTRRVLSYNKEGASSWNQSLALIDENGGIQALEFQDGQWFTDPAVFPVDRQAFFPDTYPQVIPNNEGSPEGQVDQWNRR